MLYQKNSEADDDCDLKESFKIRLERFRSKKITELEKDFYLVTSRPNEMTSTMYAIPAEDMDEKWLDNFKYYGYRIIKCTGVEVVHSGSKSKDRYG